MVLFERMPPPLLHTHSGGGFFRARLGGGFRLPAAFEDRGGSAQELPQPDPGGLHPDGGIPLYEFHVFHIRDRGAVWVDHELGNPRFDKVQQADCRIDEQRRSPQRRRRRTS